MKTSLSLLMLVSVCGCSSITGTKGKDGSLNIHSARFFWASEGINFTVSESTNGVFNTTLSVQKSSVDSAALGAVAAGVAQGLAAGVTKP